MYKHLYKQKQKKAPPQKEKVLL
ncbi:hypothetical protein XBFM1_1310117 [Xenorhabdus bovienii str. feltiae Moldova]|uniref:Uncharacterized protein n=1 Tax=Xenorhabdus bovienii str. feltiae Moldova TaxID=1398200 RepID=A0A077ND76_XENBV|nr:hypothetical protein XBFM1_1310117 [Xenorhabdus bovienii str. feltiae Moldova]